MNHEYHGTVSERLEGLRRLLAPPSPDATGDSRPIDEDTDEDPDSDALGG